MRNIEAQGFREQKEKVFIFNTAIHIESGIGLFYLTHRQFDDVRCWGDFFGIPQSFPIK